MVLPRARPYLQFVGANVRRLRLRAELTQENLAERVGFDRVFVQRIERGTVNLSVESLVRLGDVLGVEPSLLLRRARIPARKPGRPRKATPPSKKK